MTDRRSLPNGHLTMPTIRPETPEDFAAVRDVNEQAFERSEEADLIDVLRRTANLYLSLVAEERSHIIGHIFFSPVEVAPEESALNMMGLAPMAVRPDYQRQGVGSALVREGLRACAREGIQAVVVLGHPEYYPRFGFEPATAYELRSEYDVPAEAFMALELTPGALEDVGGVVSYHKAFRDIE